MALVDRYGGVVVDIDGVLCRGGRALPGASRLLEELGERGVGVVAVTNNASRTPEEIADWLAGMELEVEVERILTSALAAAELIEPGTRCLVIGMNGLRSALRERDCVLVDDPDDAEAVVVGFDRRLQWDDLRRATLALTAGARFVGTNGDPSFPSSEGLWPGNGAVLAALEAATGRRPEIAGKPEAPLFEAAAARLPGRPVLMVGDRAETDILGAAALGWDTALVLTGVSAEADVDGLEPPPTYVLRSLSELIEEERRDDIAG